MGVNWLPPWWYFIPRGPSGPTGPTRAQEREYALRNVMEWMSVVPAERFDQFGPTVSVPLRRGEVGAAADAFLRLMVRVHGNFPTTYQRASQIARGRIMAQWALSRPPQRLTADERLDRWMRRNGAWLAVTAAVAMVMLVIGMAVLGERDTCTPFGDQSGCTDQPSEDR